MPQPDFVQKNPADRVRVSEILPVPEGWVADRPAEIVGVHNPTGPLLGNVGPDQGYGLKLANSFKDKIQLQHHEHTADAIAGVLPVALKRAALFGRAPVIHDFTLAFTLFGFLGDAPADLLETRKELFAEASHHYEEQRAIADAVPESTLRMTPDQVRTGLSGWRGLVTLATPSS
jgi:hypothetical protein